MHTSNVFSVLVRVYICVLSLPGSQPAAWQWEVVYPAQTLAVYTTVFITGTVLLNYHLIYGLAWCMCTQMSSCSVPAKRHCTRVFVWVLTSCLCSCIQEKSQDWDMLLHLFVICLQPRHSCFSWCYLDGCIHSWLIWSGFSVIAQK